VAGAFRSERCGARAVHELAGFDDVARRFGEPELPGTAARRSEVLGYRGPHNNHLDVSGPVGTTAPTVAVRPLALEPGPAAGPAKTIIVLGNLAGSLVRFRGPLLQALARRGHRVVGCAPAAPADPSFGPQYMTHIVEALAAMGVTYRDVAIDTQGMRPGRDLLTLATLVALFRKVRPDIVLGYNVKPAIYGSLAARLAGVPKHFSMITGVGHTFIATDWKARALAPLVQALYRLALKSNDRLFFQNPDDRALFERLDLVRGPDQAVLINGSGIDLEAFRPAPLPAAPAFLLLARLIAEKGIREYVEAARSIRARYPGVAFRLAGRIDNHPTAISEEELQDWVKEGVIEYLGRLDDVRPAIAAASVYVLPSYREGTPRSVLEAMAMGRPIVTTDEPGCKETVQDGVNGHLVPARNVPALTAALERFVVEPGLAAAMGRESRRISIEKYDVHKVNAVILNAMGLG
jgi:glycosyltransferase involved in cell wall biosynthesis